MTADSFHTMSEGDSQMEMDSQSMSMYTEVYPAGHKAGYEASMVPMIEQEVIVENDPMMVPMQRSYLQELQDSTDDVDLLDVEDERVVELELDPDEPQQNDKVYTQLEPAVPWDSITALTSCGGKQDECSVDSGIHSESHYGSHDNSDAMDSTSKNAFDKLDSDGEEDDALRSWENKHPDNWTSKEVLDWVYYLAMMPNSEIDSSQLRGEAFSHVDGRILCNWTSDDFIDACADATYGKAIYEQFRQLCGAGAKLLPPDEVTESTGYNVPRFANPLIEDMDNGSSPLRSNIDPYLPNAENTHPNLVGDRHEVKIAGYTVDLNDVFEDVIPLTTTSHTASTRVASLANHPGYHSNLTHCNGGLVRQMAQTSIATNQHSLISAGFHLAHQATSQVAYATTPMSQLPGRRPRGRPRKTPGCTELEEGSDGEYTHQSCKKASNKQDCGKRGGPRGKRTHSNRMLHLWEFIRDLLLDPSHNPYLIRWENRREGVFRVIKSQEVAAMWGKRKQNAAMTYEKFSRSMRFCRTAGYFGEVPKDGKYPKKLCFAFGDRAYGWQHNSNFTKCYA